MTHNVWFAQGCRESRFAYDCDENMRHVCVYLRYREIWLFCIKITLSIPQRFTEVYESVTDWLVITSFRPHTGNALVKAFFSHKTNIKYSLGFATVQKIIGKQCNKKLREDGVVQFPIWTFLPSLSSKKITSLMMGSWSDLCLQN